MPTEKPIEGEEEAKPKAGKGRPWTSEEARAAARKRWDSPRETDEEIAARATGEILVPVDDEAIYKALRRKAEKGDVQAARLILERPRAARQDVLALLSPDQRAQVRAWLEVHRDA